MNKTSNYPFQSYLRTLIITTDLLQPRTLEELELMSKLSDKTLKAAQIVVGTVPILLVYPFLQKYFAKGIIIGSVKG